MNTSPQKEVNNFPLSEEEEEEEEEEGYPNHDIVNNQQDKLLSANKASSSLSTTWLTTKDPRIVRVSRGFGGKDRHSKVCTVRGLRDRRVRLSVPTAIQLYDLQDRLGLNQPSKVVDWLLNVAKDEIDELPPLPGNFINAPNNNNTTSIQNWEGSSCRLTSSSTFSRARSKEVAKHQTVGVQENEAKQEEQDQQVSSNSANYHAFGMLNNNNNNNSNVMSFGYHHHHHNWEPNLNNYPSTSNLGSQETPTDYHHNLNVVSAVPSNTLMSLSSSGSQFLVYGPAAGVTQSQYPNNNSLSMTRPSFHFSMNADHHHQVHSPSNNN